MDFSAETILDRKARIKAKAAERYLFHRDERKAKARANYYANPEKKREYAKEYRKRNVEKVKKWSEARYAKGKEYQREVFLRTKYGLGVAEYDAMLAAQGGACAICRRPEESIHWGGTKRRMSVDHCHEKNIVRGLLCNYCNRAIGLLGDDLDRVQSAADYLRKYS